MQPSEPRRDDREPGKAPLASRLVATALGTGYIPWASGTFGSLLGLLILLIPGTDTPFVQATMILLATAAGIPAAAAVAVAEGNRLTRVAEFTKKVFQPGDHEVPDPSIVVIDEVVGMWITLFLVPRTITAYILGFLLFRAMDILKPQPARSLERVPHGWGIMLDDIVAAAYANVSLRVLLWGIGILLPGLSS